MTPIEAFVKARALGIAFRLDEAGEILATLPEPMTQVPTWLRETKQAEPEGMALAVALGAALERSGGDVAQLQVQQLLGR